MAALYSKIFEFYRNQIISGALSKGQKMPTEEEICHAFDASRITARHALEMLANEGLIYKVQGKGTYVSEKKTSMQLNSLRGFSDEMRELGKVPSTIVLAVTLTDANDKIADKLNLGSNRKVYRVERIRCADGIKVAIEKVYMPFSSVPGIDKFDLTGSLYEVLTSKYDINPSFAVETLEAMLCNQKYADLLDVKINTAVLGMERVGYDKNGKIYEYTQSVYRGDKYKFTVNMK